MSKFFRYFPKTTFPVANTSFSSSKVSINLLAKTAIIDQTLKDDPYIYLPYTVRDGERPEDVAEFYYGSMDYVWLVYYSNDIVDPYDEWVKGIRQFELYLNMKYKDEADEAGQNGVIWAQANIKHYQHDESGFIMSPESYSLSANLNPDFIGGDWNAIDYYTYEDEQNEAKRSIRLINDTYKTVAESNLRKLLQQV